MVSSVTPALIWVPLAASFVIGLAAVVRMATPLSGGGTDLTGMIRLPQPVTATIVTLFSLAAAVFLVDLLRRAARRRDEEDEEETAGAEGPRMPPWLRALTQLVTLVYFIVVAYLLWRGAVPLVGGMLAGRGGLAMDGGRASPAPAAPPFVTWTFAGLAIAAGLGALAVALWVALGDRLALLWKRADDDQLPEPLAAAVEESLDDLRADADPRRAIIRCYARFERVAAASGVARRPWLTPMEFMREALGRLSLPRAAVPALTGLFELARFSDHRLGPPERDRALAALEEIRAAIDATGSVDGRARDPMAEGRHAAAG
jgi:hypothetical protein